MIEICKDIDSSKHVEEKTLGTLKYSFFSVFTDIINHHIAFGRMIFSVRTVKLVCVSKGKLTLRGEATKGKDFPCVSWTQAFMEKRTLGQKTSR